MPQACLLSSSSQHQELSSFLLLIDRQQTANTKLYFMSTRFLFVLLVVNFTGAASQACYAPANTLTTSCNDTCGAYGPCLVHNSTACSTSSSSSTNCTSVGDGVCEYTCFQAFGVNNSDPTTFIFTVPYDQQDETNDGIYATANNDIVTAIDQLNLSPQTTNVWIQGGGGYQHINKGRVVQLELADNLLASQSQVTSVSLVAIDLSARIYDIPNMVPSSVTALSLSNTLLTEFPSNLVSLANVMTLHLNDNYMTTVNSSITWEKLVELDLHQNNVATFEGNFPGLTDLYLNDNTLTKIPAIVFTLQYLTKLSIQNNPLTSRSFTQSQVNFLQALASLDLVDGDFQEAADCSLSEQLLVGDNNVVVCVSDLKADPPSSTASTSSASSSASSSLPVSRISYSSGSTSVDSDRSNSSSETSSLLVVASVAAIVVLAALVATAFYYWKQHYNEKAKGIYNNMQRAASKQRAMMIWDDPELLALQVNHDDIQDIRVIGSGAYSVVWLVRYRNSVLLASKRLREDGVVTERTQTFVEEIKLVSKLDHPNIVAFVGVAWNTDSDMQALFEYVENGDLRSYLAPSLPRYWTRVKLQLAVDVIEALVYVHAFTPPLVHGDLKSRDVLISADMQAKLTDFGVFRLQATNDNMATEVGTSRWLAPEIISGSSDYDESADIFAFGVLLSEFDTHELPYDDAPTDKSGNKLEDVAILQMVASGSLRPTFSDTCPPIVQELAKQCMSQEPRDRPPALKIAYALRTLQREAFNM